MTGARLPRCLRAVHHGGPVAVACALLAVCAAAPVAAHAAATGSAAATTTAGSGYSRVSLEGKGLKALRAQKVRMAAGKPVRVSRSALVFPVSTGALSSTVRLDSKGSLTLRRGKRRIKFTAPQVKLAKKGSITAKLGKRRITLFTVTPARGKAMRINAATGRATLQSAKVTLAKSAGRRIRKALRLRRTPSGTFGSVTVIATVGGAAGGGGGGGGVGGGSGGGGSGCSVTSQPTGSAPPVAARPAGAVPVSSAAVTWDVRESLVHYINTDPVPRGGIYPSGGATAGAPEDRGQGPLVYKFSYAPVLASSWYHPGSASAALYFAGTLNFRYFSRCIDFDLENPEIEINNGGVSRGIYNMDGRQSTVLGNRRAVLLDLAATTTAGGRCGPAGVNTISCSWTGVTLAADGSGAFAGFYAPGAEFGNLTVTFQF